MKILFEEYNPEWKSDFEKIKKELLQLIGFIDPKIEHIGSTSVAGLSAKPIIDVLVGLNSEEDLEEAITPLVNTNYIYYECFNEEMPYRRFFVKHKVDPAKFGLLKIIKEKDAIVGSTDEHSARLAHVHVLPLSSHHWLRHIAFRDYIKAHPVVKAQYQSLKRALSDKEWKDGNAYNLAKDSFLKRAEQEAIDWYKNR